MTLRRCFSSTGDRPARGRLRSPSLWALLLAVLAAVIVACAPTEGDDGLFDPVATTNDDFQPVRYVPVGNNPVSMAITGVGSDLLVAVVNNLAEPALLPDGSLNPSGTVTILQGDGAGGFTELGSIVTDVFPSQAFWAALNGAIVDDLVLIHGGSQIISVYLDAGTAPVPTAPTWSVLTGGAIAQASLVDVDGVGGANDLVFTVPAGSNLSAWVDLNADPSLAGVLVSSADVAGLSRFVAADFNGGGLDLAIAYPGGDDVRIFSGDGTGAFTFNNAIDVVDNPAFISGGDFGLGGAGSTDLAVTLTTSEDGTDDVRVLQDNGDLTFTLATTRTVLEGAGRTFPLDVVGTQDFALVHRREKAVTFFRNGTLASTRLTTTRDPFDVVAGDVSSDGNVDLIVGESDDRALGVFLGDGTGGFTRTQIGFLHQVVSPRLVDVGPATPLDLLLLQPNEDRLGVLLNAN